MLKTWKCLSGSGYIWTIESDAEKGMIVIKNHNNEVVFKEENINQKTLESVEKHYIKINTQMNTYDLMMFV